MTKARTAISASLAQRGWPEQWVNEEEAAALSGFTADVFRNKVAGLEAIGFPKKDPLNGLRRAAAIDAFWDRRAVRPLSVRELEDFS